jgi:hypothetical protein
MAVSLRPALRRLVYAAEMHFQRARFASMPTPDEGWPILLGISFPKSGTHLLDQVLLGFSRFAPFSRRLRSFYAEYEGDSGRKRPPELALAWLDSLRPRDVVSAHLFARPEVVARAIGRGFVSYFIFRDPRDVVVSHAFYVSDMEAGHVHHEYYTSLPDLDSRLKASILGRADIDVEFPDVAARFAPYAEWLDLPQVLKIRFEDLVIDRPRTLGVILDHLLAHVPLPARREAALEALESAVDPRRSPTFRSGRTGEWKKYFKPEHVRLFKSVAGDLLIRLGYETSNNW